VKFFRQRKYSIPFGHASACGKKGAGCVYLPLSPPAVLPAYNNQKIMEESKRQKQVSQLIQQEMSDIFLREGVNIIDGGMVSISKVSVTPDLLEARVYISMFQIKDRPALLKSIKERTSEWRNLLGQRVKNQLRRIPELQFFIDDTLDYVFKMEELFKQIKKDDEPE
jgi:ribosome-binding factor A